MTSWSELTPLRKVKCDGGLKPKEIRKLVLSLQIPIVQDPATNREYINMGLFIKAYNTAYPVKPSKEFLENKKMEKERFDRLVSYMNTLGDEE